MNPADTAELLNGRKAAGETERDRLVRVAAQLAHTAAQAERERIAQAIEAELALEPFRPRHVTAERAYTIAAAIARTDPTTTEEPRS